MLATTFRPTAVVYALVDPRTGRTMYVGQSVDVEYRYRQHCNPREAGGNPKKYTWISELRREGMTPTLVVLDLVGWPDSDEVERRYIREYRARGECELNRAAGGVNDRSASRPLNSHPDDWFQLGLKLKRARALLTDPSGPDGLSEDEARAAIKVALHDGHGPFDSAEELYECAREHWELGDVEADEVDRIGEGE